MFNLMYVTPSGKTKISRSTSFRALQQAAYYFMVTGQAVRWNIGKNGCEVILAQSK